MSLRNSSEWVTELWLPSPVRCGSADNIDHGKERSEEWEQANYDEVKDFLCLYKFGYFLKRCREYHVNSKLNGKIK